MDTYFKLKVLTEYIIPVIILIGMIIFVLLWVVAEKIVTARNKRIRKMNEKFWEKHGAD